MSTTYTDILYKEEKGVATITINRPKVMNAFRAHTVEELIQAFLKAGWNKKIGVIVLTGTGDRAFCTGGDQSAHVGNYDGRGTNGMPIEELQSLIRDVPKPVICPRARLCHRRRQRARHHLRHHHCLRQGHLRPGRPAAWARSIRASAPPTSRAWSARRRRARSGTCAAATRRRRRSPMGLCNVVVPHDQLDAEVAKWCEELMEKSPTALAIAKRSFNADSENIRGIGALGMQALALYYQTEESKEGADAFREKRKADFRSKMK